MPRIVTPNVDPAIRTASGAHHYRFVGIEVTTSVATTDVTVFSLARIEADDQDLDEEVPSDIVFDRCYLHGTPTGNVRRAIALNAARSAVVDSYLSDLHEVGADSQAIAIWNGPGPFKIVNNYLEGAGENLLIGGSDPGIADLVPADIEVRHNHLFKPLAWKVDDPSYAGIHWSVKNIFELKNARRVLVEGNVLENNWADGQNGIAVLFTVRNQDGGCPWCEVSDVTFQKNIVRHTPGGLYVTGTDNNYLSQQTSRILIRDNLWDDVSPVEFGGCCTRVFQVLNVDGPAPGQPGGVVDLTVDHNTARIADSDTAVVGLGDAVAEEDRHSNLVFRNNLFQRGTYGLFGNGLGEGMAALETFAREWTWDRNVMIATPPSGYPAGDCSPSLPGDDCFPATDADVGFVDAVAGDFRLCTSSIPGCSAASPYKNAGTDGKDLGADIDAVLSATAGVVSGASSEPGGQSPFGGAPLAVPGLFPAESFDLGGEGVAYHDAVPGNAGGSYRSGEDVDIFAAFGNASDFIVKNIQTGEWIEYTIDVPASGAYTVTLHASSEFDTTRFHVEVDGLDVTGSVSVPNTGWWAPSSPLQ